MATYLVPVRRIIREDTVVAVTADNIKDAEAIARELAVNIDNDQWVCYDCEYWTDDSTIEGA